MNALVTPAHDKQTPLVGENTARKLLKASVALEHLLDLHRERMETLDDLSTALSHGQTVLGELESHHEQCDVLRSVRL